MTIDEAIKRAEDVEKKLREEAFEINTRFNTNTDYGKWCYKSAEEHRQLAEWLRELKAYKEQTRWISVSERLPEYGEAVLTVDSDDEYEINHIIDTELNEWFYDGVVAWMPLPEPYKAESEEEE